MERFLDGYLETADDINLPDNFFQEIPKITKSKRAKIVEWDLLINLADKFFKVKIELKQH